MDKIIHLKSIADLHKLFQFSQSMQHPLIAIVEVASNAFHTNKSIKVSADFYTIIFKTYQKDTIKYGRRTIDFQNGSLICIAPNQVIELEDESENISIMEGWALFFHPDFIRGTTLNSKFKEYSFFNYDVTEALHLSDKEKTNLKECVLKIQSELLENIDSHSQNIIVSTIELLLNYCTRYYNRQFITRKSTNSSVVTKVENVLTTFIENLEKQSLPTVKSLAKEVHLSSSYLSDLLKKETGKNAQEYIHFYLIEEAKNILLGSNKSVNEIAYSLGFEYPQYFNKLFKQKTGKTPIEYRNLN